MRLRSLFLDDGDSRPVCLAVQALNWLLALVVLATVFTVCFHQLTYQWNWPGIYKYRAKFVQGWWSTVFISLASLAASLLLGLAFAFARRSRVHLLRILARLYVEIIRGTPLLVQILIFFYVVAEATGVSNRYAVGVLTLSFFHGAYISEIIRAGIESVGRSQLESARAVGFSRSQIYRYVIFPQALRQTLPPLAGEFASLVKNSSLLSIIGISELTLNAREVTSYTYSAFESYLPLALGYLVLTLPISLWTRRLESRSRYET